MQTSVEKLTSKINPIYLEDLRKIDHHSAFIVEDDYQILIIRGLNVSEEGLDYISKGIVLDNNQNVYYWDREKSALAAYKEGYNNLYRLVAPVYSRNRQIIDSYLVEIDHLEDSLFERKTPRIFMDIWFDIKKDLSRIERHFLRSSTVIKEFYKEHADEHYFQEAEFRDLIEQIQQNQNSANNQLSRMDALYNYHVSIKNDRLNKNIFMLTLLSAVFLPLNLIVGFFGMNTENLFFKDNPMGTQYVLMIVGGSLALSFFGLPLARFIDHHILQFFLGRYDIYKKISGKLEKILKLD